MCAAQALETTDKVTNACIWFFCFGMANLTAENHSIEPHADLEPSQSPGSQQNLAIAAPKALDSISQDEEARCSTSLDVVDDQATYKETVTGAQNDKQHRFGDQRSSSRAEMSIELDRNSDRNHGRDRDRQEGGAAAGNVYDIFAEYERIFGTTRKHCGVRKQGKDRGNDVIGDVQSRNQDFYPSRSHAASSSSPTAGAAVVAADESGCDTGMIYFINVWNAIQAANTPQGVSRHTLARENQNLLGTARCMTLDTTPC